MEDSENEHIYHHEEFFLFKKQLGQPHHINFTIPIWEPLPPQFFIHAQSDRFLGAQTLLPISFNGLVLPNKHPPHTQLLDLNPLPRTCLNNPLYESLYSFSHFNPIQTQIFHTAYHTDENILAGWALNLHGHANRSRSCSPNPSSSDPLVNEHGSAELAA